MRLDGREAGLSGLAEHHVTDRSENERTVASQRQELNVNALRELDLSVRVDELERDRWAAFTLSELEWITRAQHDEAEPGAGDADSLPAQANAELERRARASSDGEQGMR